MSFSKDLIVATSLERICELNTILFEMLMVKYEEQRDYFMDLLELFLVHIYKQKTVNEFVGIIIDEATKKFEIIFFRTRNKNWFGEMDGSLQKEHLFKARQRYFKNLSKGIKQLYILLRKSLTLTSELDFHAEYHYLPLAEHYEIIRTVASSFKREDYFQIGCISLAYQNDSRRGYSICELINILSETVAAYVTVEVKDLKKKPIEHPLLQIIEKRLRSRRKTFNKLSEEMIKLIVQMLKEYYDPANPFAITRRSEFSSLTETEVVSDISFQQSSAMEIEKSLTTDNAKVQATQFSIMTIEQQNHISSASSTETRKSRLREKLNALFATTLPSVAVDPTIEETFPLSSSASINVQAKPRKPGPISTKLRSGEPIKALLADLFKGQNISKEEAMQFFYNKKLQFNSLEDCIVSKQGIREYHVKETSNISNIFAAGVLTCILHAIRLLFVDRILLASNMQYRNFQELLTIMVTKMKEWSVEEVMKGLNLDGSLSEMNLSGNRFESFVEKFCVTHPNLFTVLRTVSWSQLSNQECLQSKVQDLYYSPKRRNDRSNQIFFLSFTDSPPPNLPLPYLFHCRRVDGADKIDSDGVSHVGNSPDDAKTTLQVVGLIYCAQGECSFQFITYARCRHFGQYEVFTKEQNGDVYSHFLVPYEQKKSTPLSVLATDGKGRPLVGLILVQNSSQNQQENPNYLHEPVVRTIEDNCSYSVDVSSRKGSCEVSASKLSALDCSKQWLHDESVLGTVYLMFTYLRSVNRVNSNNTIYVCDSWTFNVKIEQDQPAKKFLLNLKGCAFSLYIINIKNSHWVCACAPMNQTIQECEKKIYFLDSMNSAQTATSIGNVMIKFFEERLEITGYKSVLLPSSDQMDYCSCGLFTILNAIMLLKLICEEKFDPIVLKDRKPRVFSVQEKIEIRRVVKLVLHGSGDVTSLLEWV